MTQKLRSFCSMFEIRFSREISILVIVFCFERCELHELNLQLRYYLSQFKMWT